MSTEITLEEYIKQQKADLDFFAKLIKNDETVPEKLSLGDWDEQYALWMER